MTYAIRRSRLEYADGQVRRPLLGRIDIELTERCDNRCVHCSINLPEDDHGARSREMSTEFVKEILTQAAGLGCLAVRLTGGEPLLRDDLAELYVFARRLGMQVVLFTNGHRITPELAALLARIPPGRNVEVSVYGMRHGSSGRVSGKKGAFAEFRRGVALLEKYRVPFIVKAPLLPSLRGDLEEFEAWARKNPRMDGNPAYSMNFELRTRRDDPGKNARIAKLRATPEDTVEALSRNPRYLRDMGRICRGIMGPKGDRLFSCGAGRGTCIDAYGKAQMCVSLRDPETVVDLRRFPATEGLRYALTGIFPRLRELRAKNHEYLRRCARCFLKGLCDQCPAKSWAEHGTLDSPVEYYCRVAHAQARHLGMLNTGENAWEVKDWKARVARFTVPGPDAGNATHGDGSERRAHDGSHA